LVLAATIAACGGPSGGPQPANNSSDVKAAAAKRLDTAPNNSWITVGGRVVSAAADSFVLDYGYGRITVEMDDWDWYREGTALRPGDEVSVTGRIDQDLFEKRKIEASSVFVKNLNTRFFASSADEEDSTIQLVAQPPASAFAGASGFVTGISGRMMTIGSGPAAIRVSTAGMPDNPLDDVGLVKVKVGDHVQAWGRLTLGPGDKSEILASGLTVLAKDRTKKGKAGAPE
jgi:uncharacterized protein YdeI (BOF family)